MKLKLYSFSFILCSLLLFSCKTAEKLYQKGRYDEAVELAAKKLSKKPNDASLLDIAQNAYRYAVQDHESRIRNYTNSSSDLKWENVYAEYIDLQRLYESIRRSPSVYEMVQPTDYSAYINTYKEEAANARIDRGIALMENNDKNSFRDAYFEFQRALNLKPDDIAIRQRMDEAFANAVTNVVIQPVLRAGLQYSSYYYDFNNFNYNVMSYLRTNGGSSFVRYYTPAEAVSSNIRMDHGVDMRFSDVNIGRYRDQRNTREVTKQVVAKEIVYSKDSVKKEYITVKAKITTTTRVLQADGLLQATVRDYNNRVLWSNTYRGEYNWSATFSSFTGDERALSEEDKKLVNKKEPLPPSNDEIIRIIMNEIQTKTECGIHDYFSAFK